MTLHSTAIAALLAASAGAVAADQPATPLPAGRYLCATVSTGTLLDVQELAIERNADDIVALTRGGELKLTGKLVGSRLYLIRHDIGELGMEVVQIAGELHADGSARGAAVRTLDGVVIERLVFALRPVSAP